MNELLKLINEHKEKNNISVCYRLYNFIINNNINSELELKTIEDRMFNTDDKKIRNDIKYKSYLMDSTHLEKLDSNDIAKLVKYEDLYIESDINEDKTKFLILIYEINEWEMCFPYTTYKLIIEDKMI